MPKSVALLIFIVYLAALTFLSLFSIGDISTLGTEFDDKLNHFCAHFLLTILAFNYFKLTSVSNVIWICLLTSVSYGIVIEVLQLILTTDRTFDLMDLVANFIGAIAAVIALRLSVYLKLK
ncbi:MAG: VanZ family protein [Flavobacteriaceae bacterium]|nr:VanZ family protein [Flavobacteriaceae bacterium]